VKGAGLEGSSQAMSAPLGSEWVVSMCGLRESGSTHEQETRRWVGWNEARQRSMSGGTR
jgi:hypothetical protein